MKRYAAILTCLVLLAFLIPVFGFGGAADFSDPWMVYSGPEIRPESDAYSLRVSDTIFGGPVTDVRYYSSFSSAITSIGATKTTLLIPEEQVVSADVTVPSTMELMFTRNGSLSIDTGKTVTINGPLDAGLHQIVSGSGSVSFGGGVGVYKEVYPQWWGALADNSNDDTTAIQAAVDALRGTNLGIGNEVASETGGVVYFPSGRYKISAVLDIVEGVTLKGAGMFASTIYQSATDGSHAVKFKNSGRSASEFFGGIHDMWILGNSSSGDGIRLENASGSQFGYAVFKNLFISEHGGDGIYIEQYSVGGTWENIYTYNNTGDGLDMEPGTALSAQSFKDSQFRVNGGVGARIYGTAHSFSGRNVFESNTGLGIEVHGNSSVYDGLYLENNAAGAATSAAMEVYGRNNTFYGIFMNAGDGHIAIKSGASNNHFNDSSLADNSGEANFVIDSGATLNRIINSHNTSGEALSLTNNGGASNVIMDGDYLTLQKDLTVIGDIGVQGEDIYTGNSTNRIRLAGGSKNAGGVVIVHGQSHATLPDVILLNGNVTFKAESTFASGDTSPSVAGGNLYVFHADTVTIVDIDDGEAGQVINIRAVNALGDITDGGNLKLSGNFTGDADDIIKLYTPDGTTWYEISRSAN